MTNKKRDEYVLLTRKQLEKYTQNSAAFLYEEAIADSEENLKWNVVRSRAFTMEACDEAIKKVRELNK